jgi:hypothetical protein
MQYSEYGCNEVQPRIFTEVGALYGKEMTSLSGGLVYEYSQEEADYGLVVINDNGNKLDLSLIQSTTSSTNLKAPECSKSLITAEEFSTNFTIPAVCPGCADVIKNGLKSPQTGKLVDVTDTKPKQAIYGSNGVEIKDLELTKVKERQTPQAVRSSALAAPRAQAQARAQLPALQLSHQRQRLALLTLCPWLVGRA